MAFKSVLESLDGVPEDVAKEYVERDGKFHIQVEGMKPETEFTRVQSALNAERTAHSGLRDKIKTTFGDEKFEDIQAKLDKLPELEALAAGAVDEAKIEQIVEGRVKGRLAPVERELNNVKSERDQLKGKVDEFDGRERTRTVHDQIRMAAKESGLLETAIEDAILLGDRTFELSESGKAVVKDGAGFTAGLEPKDWLMDLQTKRPHWWGESVGGGAGGNRGGGSGEPNPWTDEHWNMTKQGEIHKKDPGRAATLAKSAGTSIGGARPQPKK